MSREGNLTTSQDPSKILAALDRMRDDDKLCDFRIVAGKESFSVHRNILIANSEYFRAMFSHSMKESNEGYAEISSATPKAVEACISYMYCQKPRIAPENAIDVLQVSHMLQLTGLTNACTKVLQRNLTVQNCILARRISRIYDAEELCTAASEYIADNFSSVAENDEFRTVTQQEVVEVLDTARPKCPYKLWSIVRTWIEYDPEQRQGAFVGFFHTLDFEEAPFYIHWDHIYQCPWLNPEAKKLVERAIIKIVGDSTDIVDDDNWKQLRDMLAERRAPDSALALRQIFSFIQENLDVVSEDECFEHFTYEEIEMCIPPAVSLVAVLNRPLMVWNAILKWIKYCNEARLTHLPALIEKLLMAIDPTPLLGFPVVFQKMLEEPAVRNSPEHKFMIVDKIADYLVRDLLSLHMWNCVEYKLVFVGVRTTSATINAETKVDEYIRANFTAVMNNDHYLKLGEESAAVILSCLNSYSKMFAWKAMHNWTDHEPSRAFHMLLRSIPLNCYSSIYLRKTIASRLTSGSCMERLAMDTALARDIQGKRTYIIFSDRNVGAFVGYCPMTQDWSLFQDFPHVDCACETSYLFTVQARRVYTFQGYDLFRMMGQGYGITWAKLQRIPINPTAASCAAILRGDIHVMNNHITLFYETGQYVQEMDRKWRKFERLDQDRVRTRQTLIPDEENNFLYCIGGLDYGQASSHVDKYLNDDNRWTAMPDMQVARVRPAACVHNGNVYVFGGKDEDGDIIDHAEFYNTNWSGGIWTKLRDMPYIMDNIGACVVDDRIFVFGGVGDQLVFTEYDTVDRRRRWSTISVHKINHSRLTLAGVAQM